MNFFLLALLGVSLGIFGAANPALGQDQAPQTPSALELFAKGNELYQAQEYAQAAENFRDLASRNPNHAPLFFNWGLSEYQAGRRGLGVGLWRRALAIRPGYSPAQEALTFASRQMQLREPDDGLWFEALRHRLLVYLSLDQLLGLTCILLATGGWLLLTYLGRRRKALRHDDPLPPVPWVGGVLAGLFVAAAALTALKAFENSIPRATAIVTSPVRSAPSDASSTLFEVREGADVILRQANKGWTQIRYPGGMSGWVPNEALFQTSGMQLW
jgi:tetratricopeptide (TPR) repeat protein